MRGVILLGPHNGERAARELLAAARAAGAREVSVWMLCSPADGASLPADEVVHLDTGGLLLPESMADGALRRLREHSPQLVLAYGDAFGTDLLVRLAHDLAAQCATAVTAASVRGDDLLVRRRVYGLHLAGEFRLYGERRFLAILPGAWEPEAARGAPNIKKEELLSLSPFRPEVSRQTLLKAESLLGSDTVLIAGRGLGGAKSAERLLYLGGLLGAEVGATRPVVYNGWLGIERLVGASGARISPRRCVVFGASGCRPLLLGIQGSGYLAAVNNDPEAPIFEYCDEGIVADCNQIIEGLIARCENKGTDPFHL